MKDDTLERLQGVVQKVLRRPGLLLTRDLVAEQVEGWDSLRHVQIIMRSEREFGIKFKASEVCDLENVGTLVDLINSKRGHG